MRRDFVPIRPAAALSSRLWRLCDVTPRLTRAMGFRSLLQVRKQATNLLGVDVGHERLAGIASGPARRLDFEVVPAPGLHPDRLAAAGNADPLLGGLVALDLGHACLTLLMLPACWPVVCSMLVRPLPWRAARSSSLLTSSLSSWPLSRLGPLSLAPRRSWLLWRPGPLASAPALP